MTAGHAWPTERDQIRAALITVHRRYPVASIWYGSTTYQWWAVVPGWDQLIEAPDPGGLARLLGDVVARQARPAEHAGRGDGSWLGAPQPPAVPLVWTEATPRRRATARGGGLFGWVFGGLPAGMAGR